MRLIVTSPVKSLNKAYLKQSVKREQIEAFKKSLALLFDRLNERESEEHLKNIVRDFLNDTYYRGSFEINTKDRADLVIHNGKKSSDSVGVIIEVKRPSNTAEMIAPERPNAKAMHELLRYYMEERYVRGNQEIRRLIICNIYEWYIFDAADFERFFFGNQKLVKSYKDWNDGILVSTNTDWFYQEIARPFIEREMEDLPCVCFDLRQFEKLVRKSPPPPLSQRGELDDKKLLNLYKILSPPNLLKLPFANDSNSLNREFYNELLHILGLEETKEKGKKLIARCAEGKRREGSLLENTIDRLKSKGKVDGGDEERAFSIGLELCITWLNRILFLKLLEGRLIAYHKGDRQYAFLTSVKIGDFDELDELFFDVLARRPAERPESVRSRFGNIPYLNSSLFERTELEETTIDISSLKNRHLMPLYGATVLKDQSGKRQTDAKPTLHYLFEFLDAYDFASDGSAGIQEQNKTIINAAVLGLIFEKINGYRDGSFFTPGFITMYMCRETIRRAVLRKFNETYGWNCKDIVELHNSIPVSQIPEANRLIDSLKICDPAVGSGHFLVSALNEIIAIKSELGILVDRYGKRLRDYEIEIENDELIVMQDDRLFEYSYMNAESQRVQETLFHEKERIIENCLFGVDINPKSVMICRLRLWIELLKNAYYRRSPSPQSSSTRGEGDFLPPPSMGGGKGEGEESQLETLPNIDINIKCGNSLVSRFALFAKPNTSAAQRKKLQELTEKYRRYVFDYKLAPGNKGQLRKRIDDLKHDLENFGLPSDSDMIALWNAKEALAQMSLFAYDKNEAEKRQKQHEKVEELERRFAEKERLVYSNAFEWRFEFPEVLDENGEFGGFDAVIGNPPYIRQEVIREQKPGLQEVFGTFFCGTADLYTYFYKRGLDILKTGGILCLIAPNKFMRAGYGRNTRQLLVTQAKPLMVLDFGDLPIFDEATTYPSIVMAEKAPTTGMTVGRKKKSATPASAGEVFTATFNDPEQLTKFAELLPTVGFTMQASALKEEGWTLERPQVHSLMEKLRKKGKPLAEYVKGKFYYGIKTGLNEAFVIDESTRERLIAEDPRSVELIRPWLRGRDIKKWKAKWAELYVIFTRRGVDIEAYPAIKSHLEQFRPSLEPRLADASEGSKGRKPGPYKWYEIQDNIAYFAEFERKKIVYQEIATFQSFGYAEEGWFCNNKCFLIPGKDNYLLAILNSPVAWWFLGHLTSGMVGGARAMQVPYVEQVPVPSAPKPVKKQVEDLVDSIVADPTSPEVPRLEAEIDRFIYDLYNLTEEEIALVEGRR